MSTRHFVALLVLVVLVAALTAATLGVIAQPPSYRYRIQVGITGTITTLLQPGLTASPTSVSFDAWPSGTKSPIRTVEVTNAGDTSRFTRRQGYDIEQSGT